MKRLIHISILISFVLVILTHNIFAMEITGVDGKNWGNTYNKVLDFYRDVSSSEKTIDSVVIINAIKDKKIVVKRNNILYNFVFYKTPNDVIDLYKKTKDVSFKNTIQEGELFLVEVRFPSIESNLVQEKLTKKYGLSTAQENNNNKDSFSITSWKSNTGTLIQFNDTYKNKKYTSKLYYISKKHSNVIEKDLDSFFFLREKESVYNLEQN